MMAYFGDLTPFTYSERDSSDLDRTMLNVGWLSKDHTFSKRKADQAFANALRQIASKPKNLYRGSHLCEFCPAPEAYISPGGLRMIKPLPDTAGNGEIHVRGKDNVLYVAPVLIAHYVEIHDYAPPDAFISAVMDM